MNFDLNSIVRENIKKLVPYSSARDDYKGAVGVFLDANENAFGSPLEKKVFGLFNRYPDPHQLAIKEKLATMKGLPIENIFIGNGSDEAIDILFRTFCIPGKDNVIICPPTYGMYEVSANINNIGVINIPLTSDAFQLNTSAILDAITSNTKLIFICCPNNPTGNAVKWNDIQTILESFNGVVLVDEAYIDFASYQSLIPKLLNYPNLVIIQTLSKAWGLAGLRIGMAFASEQIIAFFNKIKPPYNINAASQQLVLEAFKNVDHVNEWKSEIVEELERLCKAIEQLSFVVKIYPSQANFILVKVADAKSLYNYLIENEIIVRNRNGMPLCEDCLRITVGTKGENTKLIERLQSYTR